MTEPKSFHGAKLKINIEKSKRHAKIQNHRQSPSGKKVSGRNEKRKKKKEYCQVKWPLRPPSHAQRAAHALRSHQHFSQISPY